MNPEVRYNAVKALPPAEVKQQVEQMDHTQLLAFIESMRESPKIKPDIFAAAQMRIRVLAAQKNVNHLQALAQSRKLLAEFSGKIGEEGPAATPVPGETRAEGILRGPESRTEVSDALKEDIGTSLIVKGLYATNRKEKDAAGMDQPIDEEGLPQILKDPQVPGTRVVDLIAKVTSIEASSVLFSKSTPTLPQKKATYFLALVAAKYQETIQRRFNGEQGRKTFEQVTVQDMMAYLKQMIEGAAKVRTAVEKGEVDSTDLNKLVETVLPEETLEERSRKEGLKFNERMKADLGGETPEAFIAQNKKFSEFCSRYKELPLKDPLTMQNPPLNWQSVCTYEELGMFIAALNALRAKLQSEEWKSYLAKYGVGKPEFEQSIRSFIEDGLTIGDAIQLYGYLYRVRDEKGDLPSQLKDSDPTAAFLLQMKAVQMVNRQNTTAGKGIKIVIFNEGLKGAAGLGSNVELPPEARKMIEDSLTIAADQGAEKGGDTWRQIKEWIIAAHSYSPEKAIPADLAILYALVTSARFVRAGIRVWGFRTDAESSLKAVADKYGVSPETAGKIQAQAVIAKDAWGDRNIVGKWWRALSVVAQKQVEIDTLIEADKAAQAKGATDAKPNTAPKAAPEAAPPSRVRRDRLVGANPAVVAALEGRFSVSTADPADIEVVARSLGIDTRLTIDQKKSAIDDAVKARQGGRK